MAELTDLRTSLGAAAIVRDVVLVDGPEAIDFLQGQLSQDVTGLVPDDPTLASRPSFLLQPTGKVDAWLRVTRAGDQTFLLDTAVGHGDTVLTRLKRFKLRTKVELSQETWSGLAIRGPGASDVDTPVGARALPGGWPGVAGVDLLGLDEIALAGVPLATTESLEALRIECGVPAMGAELTPDTIPAEVGQWVVDASVSFTKGCYTGQELVARIDSRGGNVPHPIRALRIDGEASPAPGSAVLAEGKDVGTVTSSALSPTLGAIGLARLGRAVEPGATVIVGPDGPTATVAEPPLR